MDRAGAVVLSLNVTEADAAERIINRAIEAMGPLDGMALCAGISGPENIGPAFTANPADAAFRGQKAALRRLRRPKDIAHVIASLMSDAARFITGCGIMVAGAAMAAP